VGARSRSPRSESVRKAAACLLLLCLCAACDEPGSSAAPTNLLLITLDTVRADALGAYGQALPSSPHIDGLAADGVLFEQCSSSSPNTLPSHATLFTGLQPFSHGVRSNAGYALTASNRTLAEVLHEHGYRTAAEVAAQVLDASTGITQGFEAARHVDAPDVEWQKLRLEEDGVERIAKLKVRPANDITRHAVRFLERTGSEPFFLWLHYYDPHFPYTPPEPYRQRFSTSRYHGEIAYADEQLGVVLEALDELGLAGRTLVALTSDHGEGLSQHGETAHSFFVYESTLRVPLVLRGPGLPQGRRVSTPVRLLDVAPTLLELLGIAPPAGTQGRSLVALMGEDPPSLTLPAYGESAELSMIFDGSLLRSLRQGRWKYIHKVNPELYDLQTDPDEQRNRAGAEPARLSDLASQLEQLVGMAPASPGDAAIALDPETRAGLIALGYAAATETEIPDTLTLGGPDPSTLTEDAELFVLARGRLNFHAAPEQTVDLFQQLWERHPDSEVILEGLVTALAESDAVVEVEPLLRAALEIAPQNGPLFLGLSHLAERARETGSAIDALERALELDPCVTTLSAALTKLLRAEKRYLAEVELLRMRVERCDSSSYRNDYAWALATSPDPAVRDADRAVELMESILSGADAERIEYLDTLAAAYAERGEFARAVELMQQVVRRLEGQSAPESVLALFREHLAAFEASEPLRYP